MAVNILLADDHRMVREGLKQLLETDSEINVVAEAGDGYECLNLTNKTKPDIVLLDINMPNMDGINKKCYARLLYLQYIMKLNI